MRPRYPSIPVSIVGAWLCIGMAVFPGSTRAQTPAPATGGSSYFPFGSMGGFVPYSPGPGGGVGVQPGMRSPGAQMQPGGMGLMGPRPSLGLIRGQIAPLSPIGARGMGAGGGMGSMGGLIRRTPSGGPMGGMARPPVGSYPFRQPPSLLGPATAAPSMAM